MTEHFVDDYCPACDTDPCRCVPVEEPAAWEYVDGEEETSTGTPSTALSAWLILWEERRRQDIAAWMHSKKD